MIDLIKYIPSPETNRLCEALDVMERLGTQLVKQSSIVSGTGKRTDMIGILSELPLCYYYIMLLTTLNQPKTTIAKSLVRDLAMSNSLHRL